MTPEEAAAFNAGIETAAKIAEPQYSKRYNKKTFGKWAMIRVDIAARIRACKVRNDAA